MKYVSLAAGYFLDGAVRPLSEAAEIAFVRSISWCGLAESHGVITPDDLPMLVRNPTPRRVTAVVEELTTARGDPPHPLWVPVDGGWELPAWMKWQGPLEALLRRRENEVRRQREHRERVRAEQIASNGSRDRPPPVT